MMTKIGELSGSTKRLVLILATALAATASTFAQQQEEEEEATPAEKQALKELTHIQPVAASLEQIMQKLAAIEKEVQKLAAIEKEVQESQLKQAQVKKESKKQDLAQTNQQIQEKEQQKTDASEPEIQQIEEELLELELQKINIEEELQVLEKEVEELEVQLPPPPPAPTGVPPPLPTTIDPGSPPGSDVYAYDVATDTLTLPSAISKTTLASINISEANLIGMEVDETKAMTIPILRDVIRDPTHTTDGNYFNTALADVTRIAGEILTDVTLSGSIPSGRVWNAAKLRDKLGNNPYTYELAKLLAQKGAIGEMSAPNREHANIETLASDIISLVGGRDKLNNISSLNDLIGGEISEAGTGINTQLLGARKFTINEKDADLFNVKLKNINAVLGSNVTIEGGEIDVSPYLSKDFTLTRSDRKIFAIGAAKDLTIKDSVTFKNGNHVEDHALAIGAADDVHFRSGSLNEYLDEAFMAQYLHPDDPVYTSDQDIQPSAHPDHLDLTYEGSNLGLGSYDTLELVNVNVTTGGNLAVGTLKELHILSTNPADPSRITVGLDSDSDNAYLYAQERIAINGLEFGGRVNEIYMESITIDLKNVAFPSNSEVMLRSQDGRATFGAGDRALGSVNFIKNVTHGGIPLGSEHFSGPDGHVNSSITVNEGVPAVRIRAFSSANK
jgi:hypothetical protein